MPGTTDTLEILLKRQKILADFGDVALQSEDLDAVLHEACRLVAQAMGTQRAKVLEIQDEGDSLLVRAGVGWRPDIVGRARIPMNERSSESYAIAEGRPVIMQDVAQEARFDLPPFMSEEGVRALANVPIFLPRGKAYGLLQVDDTEPRDFDENDTEFLRTYANILGPIIDRLFKLHELRSAEERFRATVEAATDYAILITDAQDRITDWLPGAQAVFGWSEQEAQGQTAAITFTPEDREKGVPEQEVETARRDGHAPNVRWHQRKDGSRVFIDGVVRALHDDQGRPDGFIKVGRDVTRRRAAQERLRILLEGIPQLVWRSGNGGQWTWASPQWCDFTGQDEGATHGLGWLEAVHPDDRDNVMAAWSRATEAGALDVECRVHHAADGAYRWFQTRATLVRDDAGGAAEWLGTSTDVQDLKKFQESQAVMVAELQHRTRNLITVVRSIATQTMAQTGPTEAFRDEFNDRLAALSRVQGLLSRSEHEPITLRALLRLEFEALGAAEGDGVRLEGPAVRIRPAIVQTLALAFHELATNARKYGALSEGGGRLVVAWQRRDDETGRRLFIDWSEDDLAPVKAVPTAPGQPGGYGRRLIERALPYALQAQTTYDLQPTRLRCTIDLPLDPSGQNRSPGA